ncbi:MAG: GNAT family N-acetyltransferase [Anaerolineae bacterium]
MHLSLSEADHRRFSTITAKASEISATDLSTLDAFCHENAVRLSITRVNANDLRVVQALESDGYRLMDTLTYYAFKFGKKPIPEDTSGHVLRLAQADDIDPVTAIAEASFKGYYGHYHADPRLPDEQCDAVYVDWATRSVKSPEMADAVFVVARDGQLDGFATLRRNNEEEGEGVLFGVAPHAQGQGIYKAMMIRGMQWCQQQGVTQMIVSTQITNIAVQKVWARLGFEMNRAYYTLHKWF